MKQILFIAFIGIVLSACSPKQHTTDKEKAPAALVEMNLKIGGMTCTECEQSIAKGVKQLPGIDSISANHLDSTAFVRFDSTKTNLKEISAAIAKRGYEVR
jgi:copper chaperone CopZ